MCVFRYQLFGNLFKIDALRDELLTLSVLDLSAVCELYFEALRCRILDF